jgi:hypothetical protein
MGDGGPVDPAPPLVLDASAVINLLASGRATEVLTALGGTVVVVRRCFDREVLYAGETEGFPGGRGSDLVDSGLLAMAELSAGASQTFLALFGAPIPDALGVRRHDKLPPCRHEELTPFE